MLDANRDGVPDMVLPDDTRTRLRIVSFAGGRFRELGRVALPAEAVSAFRLADLDGDGRSDVALRLSNGQVVGVIIRP